MYSGNSGKYDMEHLSTTKMKRKYKLIVKKFILRIQNVWEFRPIVYFSDYARAKIMT